MGKKYVKICRVLSFKVFGPEIFLVRKIREINLIHQSYLKKKKMIYRRGRYVG